MAAVTTDSEVMAESSAQSAVGLRDAATHLELRPNGARSRPDMSEESLRRMDVDQDVVAESEVPVVLLEGASMQSAVGDHDTAVASGLQPDGTRSRTGVSEESLYQMDVDQNEALEDEMDEQGFVAVEPVTDPFLQALNEQDLPPASYALELHTLNRQQIFAVAPIVWSVPDTIRSGVPLGRWDADGSL